MAPLIASCVGETIKSDNDQAIVPWWSITKTALSACALRLAAGDRLELDRALPGRQYTLRQLLQHTSGLGCYTDTPDYEAAVDGHAEPWSVEQHARFAGGPPSFEPSRGWKYSNSGYFLVRSLIEQATGMDIGRALKSLVLSPLGIERSFVATTRADLQHSVFGDEDNFHPGWVAHGLLMGPPSEVASFMHRLFTGALLPAQLIAAMRERHPVETDLTGRPWRTAGYGLGLMIDIASPHGLCIGHSGQGPASVSAAYHFPDLSPPVTVAAFAPTDDQGVAERAVLEEAARLR
ncbi:MAG: beta-lactamase family protein [Xanthobacteraceae bacterium]|nr:beta-lactamase family protein [Xanthobacteraceae bacterium]